MYKLPKFAVIVFLFSPSEVPDEGSLKNVNSDEGQFRKKESAASEY